MINLSVFTFRLFQVKKKIKENGEPNHENGFKFLCTLMQKHTYFLNLNNNHIGKFCIWVDICGLIQLG